MAESVNADVQQLMIEMMLDNAECFVRVQNIFNPESFDRSLAHVARFISSHAEKYSALPTFEQVNASCNIKLHKPNGLKPEHYDWFYDEFESFCKRKALERAILKSVDLLDKGEFDPVEKLIKDAVQIGLTRDLGTNYYADPKARLQQIKEGRGQVSTGWPALDKLLYGGMNRGELNIFAGGSGSGKSLFMQNMAVMWSQIGLNGIYLTLELSENLCSMRMDSMVANISSRDIFKNLDDVELKVKMASKKAGQLQIKYMPAQSNVNDIRAFMREYQIQTGIKPDFIMVDYLDLLMPVSAKVSPNDQFIKDKYVSEELRNLAKELDILLVTASQLNRAAVDEIEFDHSHIAGGISKINTADNVFGIFTSRAMRERGRYQLQLLKTRSSSGVGMKVELSFDVDSLRITDDGEAAAPGGKSPNSLMKQIKGGKTTTEVIDKETGEIKKVTAPPPTVGPKVKAEVQSTMLNNMLRDLNSKRQELS